MVLWNTKARIRQKRKKVCIVDVQGIHNLIKYYGQENLLIIYLKANDRLRKRRARQRPNYCSYEWERRLLDDREQFEEKNMKDIVNYTISTEQKPIEQIVEQIDNLYINTLIEKISKILNINKKESKKNGNKNNSKT